MGTQIIPSPRFPVSSAQAEREEKVEKPQEASPEQAEIRKSGFFILRGTFFNNSGIVFLM